MCNYPDGSNNSLAPWNEKPNEYKELKVTISLTISKTVSVYVNDYIIEDEYIEDHELVKDINFEDCDLKQAVKNQITLPTDTKEFSSWIIDDFEVIKED